MTLRWLAVVLLSEVTSPSESEKKKRREKKKKKKRGPTYCSWQKNWHGKPTLNASLLHQSPSIPLPLHLLLSLSPSDGWPLQYIWLIFSADWVREHVKEWKGERGRRWRWRCWTGQPVWSPGTAAWTGSAVLQKWELDSLTWLDIKK